jgi:hypothetical protein
MNGQARLDQLLILFRSDAFRSVAMIITVGLMLGQYWDRRVSVRTINANLDKFEISQKSLGARAKIQVILLNQALENRPLTATEIDSIKQLWQTADLDTSEKQTTEER